MTKIQKTQNLFLISIHRKSLSDIYDMSVKKPVSKKILENYNFTKTIQKKNVAVWGLINTEENYKIWKEIQNSDLIMFFDGKKMFSKTRVIKTIEDKNLPRKIWNEGSFLKNRNLLIFLDMVEPIELEYDACIPILLEPKISNAYFFPIKKIETKKKQLLESTFDNLGNEITFLADPKKKDSPISEYLSKEENDEVPIILKPGISKQRSGQKKFSKNRVKGVDAETVTEKYFLQRKWEEKLREEKNKTNNNTQAITDARVGGGGFMSNYFVG